MRRIFRPAFLALTLLSWIIKATAAPAEAIEPLLQMGLGDLMKVKVTSLQRRDSELRKTLAPTYVMDSEAIRRSGATTIPDLLRRVPGVHVARINGNTWAISARGFNSAVANKLLVLVDGRSVYSPLFAGVFWDVQEIPLESIDRIEVIRGPGGALWGANAVNGIINIIRKSPKERLGSRVSVTAGDEDRFIGEVSQGAELGKNAQAVVYGRYREFDALRRPTGGSSEDDGSIGSAGVRAHGLAAAGEWMVSSDAYDGKFKENRAIFSLTPPSIDVFNDDTDVAGMNLVAQIRRKLENGAAMVRTFYDRSQRRIPRLFDETRETFDLEVQRELPAGPRHTLTYGAGVRSTTDRIGNTFSISWDPSADTTKIFSLFAQDQMKLTRRSWIEVGSKFERNDYTHWETQPNLRLGFQPDPEQLWWAAVSRAVRTPTRYDRDVRFPGVILPGPATLEGRGSDLFDSEKVVAYEAGYRSQPTPRFFTSNAVFFNRYSDLHTFEAGAPEVRTDPVPHTAFPFFSENRAWGESFGFETSERYQVVRWWTVEAQYTYLHLRLHLDEGSADFTTIPSERSDPSNQFTLISNWTMPHDFEFDGIVRWVDELKALGVDDYTAIDLRLGWRATPSIDTEIVGQNLFESSHREYAGAAEVEPSVHAKISWRVR
jgi:iron complex outermembrane recepter protein